MYGKNGSVTGRLLTNFKNFMRKNETVPVVGQMSKIVDKTRKKEGVVLESVAKECHMSLRSIEQVKKGKIFPSITTFGF